MKNSVASKILIDLIVEDAFGMLQDLFFAPLGA
jgi:hypothetical protein